ncbi:MAG: 2-oxoacid:acceptor oxidoreductase subunit alpha, partial [Muribaculaceae bacterium]|nr:2-oxoacid:acceptor oxidoreductase subunit alpha [Muribaculaceae bacterium]
DLYTRQLPSNALEEIRRYKNVIVAELNTGMFADYLQQKLPGVEIKRINKIEGQPFMVSEIVDGVIKHINEK